MNDTIDSLKDAEKEAMDSGSQPRRVRQHNGNTTAGLILIGIGTFFLLSHLTNFHLHNWWALFILIPAVHNLRESWHSYRVNGRLTRHARHSVLGGILIGMVAIFFLFSLSWNLFWPLALIILGVSSLLNGRS